MGWVQENQEIRSTGIISKLVQNSFLAVCTLVVTCSCTINRRFKNRLHDQLYHHHHSITLQNTRARQGWLMVWKTCPARSMDHNGSSSFQRFLFSWKSPMSLNISSTVYEQNIASDVEGSSSWASLGTPSLVIAGLDGDSSARIRRGCLQVLPIWSLQLPAMMLQLTQTSED